MPPMRDRQQELTDALRYLNEIDIAPNLQPTALAHLLQTGKDSTRNATDEPGSVSVDDSTHTLPTINQTLRSFCEGIKTTSAVQTIPLLFYWAQTHEGKSEFSEQDTLALFRRAKLRPPKNIPQSFYDLTSKRYMRIERCPDNSKHVRLSRVGEDFVLHELIGV